MKDSYLATHLLTLFDRSGRILAGVPVHEGYVGPVPIASEGQEIVHFELPEAVRGRPPREIDVAELCTTHKVDTHRRALTLKSSSAE